MTNLQKVERKLNELYIYFISIYEPKRYIHDCDKCHYLGRFKEYDLYFCVSKPKPTVIGRFSSEGADYISGMCFANHNEIEPLYEAKKRANKFILL